MWCRRRRRRPTRRSSNCVLSPRLFSAAPLRASV
jgi:hypothetical protein